MTPFAYIMLAIFGVWAITCLAVVAMVFNAICGCWFEDE